MVEKVGQEKIKIGSFTYTRGDVSNFFSHLAFEIGEHHENKEVQKLVDALYRYTGLSPDPPDEFDGYWDESKDDGFAIIEINVKAELREIYENDYRKKQRT